MNAATRRVLEFFEYLVKAKMVKNATQFAKKIGRSPSMISELREGRSEAGIKTLLNIISVYDQLNDRWLLYGIGEMLLTDKPQPKDNDFPKIVTVDNEGRSNAVLVAAKAAAGYRNGYADPEFIATLPAYSIPGMSRGHYRMFEVSGHSMHPTLYDKDIAICQYASRSTIKDELLYVIVTKDDGLLVKRVLNRVKKDGTIILLSDNKIDSKLYPPIILNAAEDVLEMWKVINRISDPNNI